MAALLEVCVDAVDSALAAQDGGALRVELCDDLSVGGITPAQELVEAARAVLTIGLHVMIRPRGGDFCYSAKEFDEMKSAVLSCRRLAVDGIVTGMLLPDRSADVWRLGELARIARPMQVTFHRAFDEAADSLLALDAAIVLGIDRILTSGRRASAREGVEEIKNLIDRSAGRVAIMPGGGIDEGNAAGILASTGARELHVGSAVRSHRGARAALVSAARPLEGVTDAGKVRHLLSVMNAR